MGDLVVRDRGIVPEAEVRAEQPICRPPEDNHRVKPAFSRLRELGAHAFHIFRAAQLGLARRSKVLAVVRRADRICIGQRSVGHDRPNAGSAECRAIPTDVIDGTREPTPALRLEGFVKRAPRAVAKERDPRFVGAVWPRRFAVDESAHRSLRWEERRHTSAKDASFW